MDAIFMMMPGERERTIVHVILQIIFQYVMNLSIGEIWSL